MVKAIVALKKQLVATSDDSLQASSREVVTNLKGRSLWPPLRRQKKTMLQTEPAVAEFPIFFAEVPNPCLTLDS